MTKIAFVVAMAVASVLPTLRKDHVRTAQLSRGGAGVQLAELIAASQALEEAHELMAGRERVLVLPFKVAGAEDGEAIGLGVAREIAAGLHYAPAFVSISVEQLNCEAPRAVAGASDLTDEQWQELAKKTGVATFIAGEVSVDGDKRSGVAVLVRVRDAQASAAAQAKGETADGVGIGSSLLLALLENIKKTPSAEAVEQIKAVGAGDPAARAECDRAYQILCQAAGQPEKMPETLKQAKAHAEKACELDPRLARAYLLAASCAHGLDEANDRDRLLKKAKLKRAKTTPTLEQLEIDADYARFVGNDVAKAREIYKKVLEIDPLHYVALFSYVETYLNDGGVTGASDEELAEAAKYAARLLAAHPRSAGAEILRNAQPAQPQ